MLSIRVGKCPGLQSGSLLPPDGSGWQVWPVPVLQSASEVQLCLFASPAEHKRIPWMFAHVPPVPQSALTAHVQRVGFSEHPVTFFVRLQKLTASGTQLSKSTEKRFPVLMNSLALASETVRRVRSLSFTTERPPDWRMFTRLRTTLESPVPGILASKSGYARSRRAPARACGVSMLTVTTRCALGEEAGVQVPSSFSQ